MDIDYKEVFPESAQTELPEIPEEDSEDGDSAEETAAPPPSPAEKQVNRRFTLRPRKRTNTDIEGNIKKVLHNVLKAKGPLRKQHLETIFEEPIKENGKVVLVSVKKAKRAISFTQFVSKAKQRKRKAKAKKIMERISDARINEVQRQFWKMDL